MALFDHVGWGADPAEYFDIYVPPGTAPEGGWPLIMFVPGGGLASVAPAPPDLMPFILNQDHCMYVVVNYRTGIGAQPALDDVATVARLVYDHAGQWGANPERIGWLGHSAGCYLLAEIALDTRRDVPHPPYGMCLMAPAWLDHDPSFADIGIPQTTVWTEEAFGTPDTWADLCPIEHLDGPHCRGVVVFGTNDDEIPHQRWTWNFLTRAHAAGHDFRGMMLPGRTHLIDPAQDGDAAQAVDWTMFGT
jgi:acetyl esterase/lipase